MAGGVRGMSGKDEYDLCFSDQQGGDTEACGGEQHSKSRAELCVFVHSA